ncbi:MAG: hypothetical protein ACREMN_05910 [Gemmatimonadales bacterium]
MRRLPVVRLLGAALVLAACVPQEGRRARSTLVIGLDVSGSFRQSGHFDESIEFAALYIYGHLNGLGELRQPTDIFVGSLGGRELHQPKSFHPIQDLTGKSVEQIANDLRSWFPETDPITDFNTFFNRVAVHIKRQNLVLAPLNIVMFSDGEPDFPGAGRLTDEARYRRINLEPIEYLSRSVTVRLLYATPRVAQLWEQRVPRKRVRLWTQDWQVMRGWARHRHAGVGPEQQDSLWSWMRQIVDFRVRRGRIL